MHAPLGAGLCARTIIFISCLPRPRPTAPLAEPTASRAFNSASKAGGILHWRYLPESVQLSRPWGAEKGVEGTRVAPHPRQGSTRGPREACLRPRLPREDCPRATAAAPGPRWAGRQVRPSAPAAAAVLAARRPRFTPPSLAGRVRRPCFPAPGPGRC